jgi:hypothetical protein
MIFFFGVKGKSVHNELLTDQECTHCGQINTTYVNFTSRYVHCFWIPLFPIGKKAFTYCSHCKQTLSQKEMPVVYKSAVEQHKANAQTPVWHYSGLLIFCLLVFLFFSII